MRDRIGAGKVNDTGIVVDQSADTVIAVIGQGEGNQTHQFTPEQGLKASAGST